MLEIIIESKKCSKCKELKLFQDFSFRKDINSFRNECKKCRNQYNKKYYVENSEKIISSNKKYYEENKEKINVTKKIYSIKNKEKISNSRKTYREINKEKLSLIHKKYRQENKQELKEKSKNKYISDRFNFINKSKQYYLKNINKILEYKRKYNKIPEKNAIRKIRDHNRRLIENKGDVTTKQLLELQQNAKVCYWCGISLKKVKVHIDHYTPLSKGGEHTISNLVISCQHCNNKKYSKDPLIFANSIGKLL